MSDGAHPCHMHMEFCRQARVPLPSSQQRSMPLQRLPQAPQCESVFSCCSQPSLASPLQSPKPALQVKEQPDMVQVAVALAGAVQLVPQAPQLLTVSSRLSQPLPADESQSP